MMALIRVSVPKVSAGVKVSVVAMLQAAPGVLPFSRPLPAGLRRPVGDAQTTFDSLLERWKTFFVLCLRSSDLPLMSAGDCAEMPSTRTPPRTRPPSAASTASRADSSASVLCSGHH
ncbi:uncharacterized protein BKA55DRAFT_59512 [Fusarium redolens]|uniref:Uncharacterized protein n=1 Tax=Fusarium redolens TaxID=48865 RepID=A0A9P9KYH5_FUSRE|nr:uncharacterized protein BKA55DRAFT_59512 [Fusarium redolens]KAH7270762.1 hypothetical protein BKA55DRAFT_59512 [Fusarium redolens]